MADFLPANKPFSMDCFALLRKGEVVAIVPKGDPELVRRLAGALAADATAGRLRAQGVCVAAHAFEEESQPVPPLHRNGNELAVSLILSLASSECSSGNSDVWSMLVQVAKGSRLDEPTRTALIVCALISKDPRAQRAIGTLYRPQTLTQRRLAHICLGRADRLLETGRQSALVDVLVQIASGGLRGYRAIARALAHAADETADGIEAAEPLLLLQRELRDDRARLMQGLRCEVAAAERARKSYENRVALESGLLACEGLLSENDLCELIESLGSHPRGALRLLQRIGEHVLETGLLPEAAPRTAAIERTLSRLLDLAEERGIPTLLDLVHTLEAQLFWIRGESRRLEAAAYGA